MQARKRAADNRIAAAARRHEQGMGTPGAIPPEVETRAAPPSNAVFDPPTRLTITELLAMIDEQREEIRRLEEALAPTVSLPPSWRLTALERDVLFALMRGVQMSKERIHTIVYGVRCDDPPHVKIIDVAICKIRRKLAVYCPDALITTVWGQGYIIEAASLSALKSGIERALADPDHAPGTDQIGDAA
ncbi:putative two component transcriptionalregulator, winged helix family [Methylobacterium aquaticum]|uniref:Putative two component transcriptionalregulator, winged helix family n=2 Tax=Methylobacterium aquaticum TaxID=270351 RepID=A0A0C6F7Q1_9HYPH|nr:putative two component transcriptionalregulator, winged helix family [Methylobacterium aquaticum]